MIPVMSNLRHLILVPLLCMSLGFLGCEKEELKQQERQAIDILLKTGSSFKEDPYVRAETLRVLEMLADSNLNSYALSCVEDPSPMVGVAAIRVLLATKNPDARRQVFRRWNQAKSSERKALFVAVKQLGDKSMLLELSQKALRAKDNGLRYEAFRVGVVAPIEEAKKKGDEDKLRRTLLPDLGRYVKNPEVRTAAESLRIFKRFGQTERAEPYLSTLKDERKPLAQRLNAARVLRRAEVEASKAIFGDIIARHKRPVNTKKLGLPGKAIDPALVRTAYLGLVALGDVDSIKMAQGYLTNASTEESIEVLEALVQNKNEEVTVSLKIAMQDARTDVRHLAIDLYGSRKDARAKALINALRQDDFRAKRKIATILVKRFPEDWSRELKFQLQSDRKDLALKLMRDVIVEEEDTKVLEPLKSLLLKIIKEKDERAATAAYLLLLTDPKNQSYLKSIENARDVHTRYVFLEHLVRHQPVESIEVFRRYFSDDLYALRLLSAAGLLRAFKLKDGQSPKSNPKGSVKKESKPTKKKQKEEGTP